MPVRIRLSRRGAKKRPFYQIVVADSRRAINGKFIDRIGTYNPMLPKDHPERIKINNEKAKEWIQKGAQPSDRVHLFLSNVGILDKPIITEKTKKHLPKKKAQERLTTKKEANKPVSEEKVKEDPSSSETKVANEGSDKKTQSENSDISKETIEKKSAKKVEILTDNIEVNENNKSNKAEKVEKEKEGKSS